MTAPDITPDTTPGITPGNTDGDTAAPAPGHTQRTTMQNSTVPFSAPVSRATRTASWRSRRTAASVVAGAALLVLAGCGSDDASGTDPSAPTTQDGGVRPGFDAGQLDQIRTCLAAAGLDDALPTGGPSGRPSNFPSDLPSDLPSDMPSDFASGGPGGVPGGGGPGGALGGALSDPDVQAALEACGIDLPSEPGAS